MQIYTSHIIYKSVSWNWIAFRYLLQSFKLVTINLIEKINKNTTWKIKLNRKSLLPFDYSYSIGKRQFLLLSKYILWFQWLPGSFKILSELIMNSISSNKTYFRTPYYLRFNYLYHIWRNISWQTKINVLTQHLNHSFLWLIYDDV